MTTPPALFADDTDFVLKIKDSHLEPNYQIGDHVSAKHAATAEPGDIVVVLVEEGASVRRWPVEDAKVIGAITGMFRRLA